MVSSTIPKIIHQMWLDLREADNENALGKYENAEFRGSFGKWHPDFQFEFWNKKRIDDLFKTHADKLDRWKGWYYNTIKHHFSRCEVARYLVLYIFGGLYLDVDFRCLRPLSPLVENREMLLTHDVIDRNSGKLAYLGSLYHSWKLHCSARQDKENTQTVFAGFMGSAPNHPFWSQLLDYLVSTYRSDVEVQYSTGSAALGDFVRRMQYTSIEKPNWYINNCQVMPLNTFGRERCFCQAQKDLEPYVTTKWSDSTYVKTNPAYYLRGTISNYPVVITLTMSMLLVLVILIVRRMNGY